MSKKKTDHNMLLPGSNGWDLWSCSSNEVKLERETNYLNALDIDKLPANKPILMAFPVKELTALELWIPSQEQESSGDLVALQVERMGLAEGEENGVLHQHSHLFDSADGDQSLYSIDVLRAPVEGSLPKKSPNRFSVSPRCYHFDPNSVTFWQEFNKWVISISGPEGRPVHYQGFTTDTLDISILEDTKFILGQLLIQGILKQQPENFIIWTSEEGLYPDGYDLLEKGFGKRLHIKQKPTPIIPPPGQLLPADTRAERVAAKRKKQQNILTTIIGLLILGVIGYGLYALWNLEKEAKIASRQAETLKSSTAIIEDHISKWDELEPLLDSENDPIALLIKTTQALPNDSLILTRATYTHQTSEKDAAKILTIVLEGEAEKLDQASKYAVNLEQSEELSNLDWENQNPTQTKTGWRFNYHASAK